MSALELRGPGRPFRARAEVPGDKSLSHRALLLAGMADGASPIRGLGPGRDVAATARALRLLGVEVGRGRVVSKGVAAWHPAPEVIDCGNSGTTLRLLAGALAGRPFPSVLDGDASLRRRPMGRLVGPLTALGADVEVSEAGTPPVSVRAPSPLRGTDVVIDLASAQVRSAFALAALQAEGPSSIDGPPGFRDHTERWFEHFGLGHRTSDTRFVVLPGPVPAVDYDLPGDPSSAAFLWAAAASLPGARVEVPDVSLNPGRIGFLGVLVAMGAEVDTSIERWIHGDPAGSVSVGGRGLRGVEVAGEQAVAALDELPLVAVLGMLAEGLTVVRDAAELRAKESDRIVATVEMIRSLGGDAEATDDGFVVVGDGPPPGGIVDAMGDHRIAMAAAVAATAATGPVRIVGADVAAVSWPTFYDELEALWSSR